MPIARTAIAFTILLVSNATAQNHRAVELFLTTHCGDCHSEGAAEGGFDLDKLGSNFSDAATFARWQRIHDRIALGEMPPADAEQPTDSQRSQFLQSISVRLTDAHLKSKATVYRRLNRSEYQNTINDVFGVNLDLISRLPEDGRSHEFENVGSALNLSSVQLDAYLKAADAILDAAIAKHVEQPEFKTVRASYADTRGAEKFLGSKWLKLPDGAVVFYQRLGYPTGMLREAVAPESGWYDIRVTGYGHQTDKPITFAIGSTSFAQGSEKGHFGFFQVPPKQATTVSVRAWMDRRYMVEVTPWGIFDPDYLIKKNGIKNYKGPGLAIKHIEIDGPITESFPSAGHTLLFSELRRKEIPPRNPKEREKSWYRPKFEIVEDSNFDDAVDQTLLRVATKLFRRDVELSQLSAYRQLFDSQRDEGNDTEQSLRTAVAAMLCSSDFLFLGEKGPWLDDWEIANRLSYFLNRTAPDDALRHAARDGLLSKDRDALIRHAKRLQDNQHFERFINDFVDAWLGLRDIDFTAPDRKLFPEFDFYLKKSMIGETRAYLRYLIDENLPVRNLVKSDFAILNERLARHYGVSNVDGPNLRPVKLPSDSRRGGLLSQGSILKITANGTNTSPVVRGVWVNERILGNHPQPPPPGVPGVEPDIRGAKTLRQQLDQHRDSDTCRACHRMIDPPGFALECFDPIGGYRDFYRTIGGGEKVNLVLEGRKVVYRKGLPVDSSGETTDGKSFAGFRQFRDHVAADEDRLARVFAEKLLTFATGRDMGFSDRQTIDELVQASKAKGHRMGDLVLLVIQSPQFRQK